MDNAFADVINALHDLRDDSGVPKNLNKKIDELVQMMKTGKDVSITVNKALAELDDLSDDINIPQHVRTQIWHIASLLETI